MMPSQEEALRIKKRVPPNTTEEQRWNEVYLILFPEETGVLPSPCKFVCNSTPSVTTRLTYVFQSTKTNKPRHAQARIPNSRKPPTPGSAVPLSTRGI